MKELGKFFDLLLQVDKRNNPEKYQPERSKREDLDKLQSDWKKLELDWKKLGCGALNTVETQ
jgi:hypothetical protein